MDKSKKIKIIIINNNKIGDMILTLPVIKAIKENYPYSDISVVCSNANAFLCKEASFIDKYHVFDKRISYIGLVGKLQVCRFFYVHPTPKNMFSNQQYDIYHHLF